MNNIQFVVFDYDGVFSDGKCHFDDKGNIHKYYDIKDGMALALLKKRNIKIGLISSYKTEKPILIRNNLAQAHLIEHLGFDYVFIGKADKKTILTTWLRQLHLTMKNVAYIGDDINDIILQREVAYSACPSDASRECKEIVDFICKKKGGDGAVREFIETIISPNNSYFKKIQLQIKNEMMYQILNFNERDIIDFTYLLKSCPGNIYTMGIGKSGNIAKHFADILKSISISIYYLDTINALHGDIGPVKKDDYVILFSKSGNTYELQQVIPFLKHRTDHVYGICCEKDSYFEKECKHVYITPFQNEIDGTINKIPTNSYMSHLVFVNFIVSLLKNNISLDSYKNNHPAGSIGNALLKVKEVLIKSYPKIMWNDTSSSIPIVDILLEMTKFNIGCCLFINNNYKLIGLLVDGDIRRLLLKKKDLQNITINDITTDCFFITNEDLLITSINKHYKFVPFLDKENNIIGLVKL